MFVFLPDHVHGVNGNAEYACSPSVVRLSLKCRCVLAEWLNKQETLVVILKITFMCKLDLQI